MAATDDHPPATPSDPPHVSVLIDPIIDTVAPVQGRWLDVTSRGFELEIEVEHRVVLLELDRGLVISFRGLGLF